MFEIYQLRYFLAVVETGSFTKAAQRVGVSQPSLSAGIRKLEQSLQTPLFDRSNRRVFLTPAGSLLVERARTILSECQLAQDAVRGGVEQAVVRLGVLTTVPAQFIARLLEDFQRDQPGTVVELFEGTEQELHNRMQAGRLDCGISILRSDARGRSDALYEEGYSLALSAGHALAERPQVDVTELAREPIIVRRRCEVLSETSRFFTDHNVRPRLVYRTDQDERCVAMVAAGLGITVMPDGYRHEGVARRPLIGFDLRRRVGFVRPGRAALEAAASRLREVALSQNWSA